MVKLWDFFQKEYKKYGETMMLDGYSWDESGLKIMLRSLIDIAYLVQFPLNTEAIRVEENMGSSMVTQNTEIYLVEKSNAETPCAGFFIMDESEMIDRVKEINSFSGDIYHPKKYLHYIMITEDFWVEVVSSEPPTTICLGKV